MKSPISNFSFPNLKSQITILSSPLTTFFDKFDSLADTPEAVAKVRELMLEWAASGKLCNSGANDWRAGVLGDVIELISGQHLLAHEQNKAKRGIPYLTGPSDFGEKHPIATRWTDQPKVTAQPGDILITVKGSGVGKTNTLADQPTAISRQLMAIRVTGADREFVHVVVKRAVAHFQAAKTGIAIPGIGRDDVLRLQVVFPPLAEQKRIVAKVDELMAQCDRLEAQLKARDEKHAVLARAALARFAESPTTANLELLFHDSFAIPPADLRKTILTLAVQGKLVPQDPNDEPAEELIARIAHKRRAKKAKEYAPVDSDEVAFDIPDSWLWVRLGNLSMSSDSGWSPQCSSESRSGNEWGVLKVSAVSWGGFDPEANKALPAGVDARPECEVRPGDFLLSRANTEELVARSVVVEQTPPRLMMSDKIVRFTFPDEIEKAFINLANLSGPARDYYMRNASGTSSSMKNIGREVMCNLPVPLPPLAEQRRIVKRVDELMALVDQLEAQLTASRAAAEKLLSALIAELTASA